MFKRMKPGPRTSGIVQAQYLQAGQTWVDDMHGWSLAVNVKRVPLGDGTDGIMVTTYHGNRCWTHQFEPTRKLKLVAFANASA